MRVYLSLVLLVLLSCNASKNTSDSGTDSEMPKATEPVVIAKPKPKTEVVVTPNKEVEDRIWQSYSVDDLPDLEKRINPSEFDVWQCDYNVLRKRLAAEEPKVKLPTSKGLQTFILENSGTMSPELAEKFPNIRSFKGTSTDGKTQARLDTNDEGLFVEFTETGSEQFFLSPLLKGSKTYYATYRKDALTNPGRDESYE